MRVLAVVLATLAFAACHDPAPFKHGECMAVSYSRDMPDGAWCVQDGAWWYCWVAISGRTCRRVATADPPPSPAEAQMKYWDGKKP